MSDTDDTTPEAEDERDPRDILAADLLYEFGGRLTVPEQHLLHRCVVRSDYRARVTERRLALRLVRRALGLGELPPDPPNLSPEEMETFLMRGLVGEDTDTDE